MEVFQYLNITGLEEELQKEIKEEFSFKGKTSLDVYKLDI